MRPVKTGTTHPYLPSQLLPKWILTFVSLNIYLKGQDATNKMSWYTFGCSMILHLSDVTALNEAWKRGYWDQSMRAPLGTGRRAEQHKQDDRRWGGPGGELIRDIMSYSEQGKVALYCEPIVHWEGSITCNTWHDDTIPVWEGGFSVYFTQSWPVFLWKEWSHSCQMTIIQIIFQTQSHEERQEERGGETLGSGARAQRGAAAWHLLLHLTCT